MDTMPRMKLSCIANHPFGVMDGLILGHLVSQVRSRFVALVNELLHRRSELASYFLPVDFRETKEEAVMRLI